MQVAVLIDNLKHDDASERQRSFSQLERIAAALGAKRTREELIPFLCDCVDDDDELLLAMIAQLPALTTQMGGDGFAHHFFPLLQLLCSSDSKIVRDAAVEAAMRLQGASAESAMALQQLCLGLLQSEWYNQKQSGIQLAGACLAHEKERAPRAQLF